jgi:hypothetical protein
MAFLLLLVTGVLAVALWLRHLLPRHLCPPLCHTGASLLACVLTNTMLAFSATASSGPMAGGERAW